MILGQVVFSKAGRDSGRKFVVVGIVDELHVLISDGDSRKIDKPKKKKLKHLEIMGQVPDDLQKKLKNGQSVTNSEIRRALAVI